MFLDNQVRIAFNRRKHLSVGFLDISKAFDRTWHTGLLFKLFNLGVTGRPWRWCRAFLTDRRLRTTQDGLTSDWFHFNAGVPQGSVLSPFLFLVFINDVTSAVRGKALAVMFADDIALVPVDLGRAGDLDLKAALIKLDFWARDWRVTFNAKKSKVLCFTSQRKQPKVCDMYLAGSRLERVKEFDYLGIRWQENGKWDAHLRKVTASATRVAAFISATLHRNGPPASIIRQLCHALIRTKILYGMPIWSPSRETDWNRLDALSVDPLRKCLGLPKSTHLQSLLVESNTLSIRRQFDVLTLTTCHRALTLPAEHESPRIIRSQQHLPPRARNPPIPAHAASICHQYDVPKVLAAKSELTPRAELAKQALKLQRLKWRRGDSGRRLKSLATLGTRVPEYFFSDARPVAIVRARLRFDRAALAESMRRRGYDNINVNCAHCNQVDDLEHLLHDCKLLPRTGLISKAQAAQLPVSDRVEFRNWLLGSIDLLHSNRKSAALSISGEFLLAASSLRHL